MERITRRIRESIDFVDGKGYAKLSHEESTRLLFERLAEYEDIGLTSEEIKYFLRDFGITVTKRNRELIKELQKYRKLNMEGRLIKLPCKVGDTAYRITCGRDIEDIKVKSFIVEADEIFVQTIYRTSISHVISAYPIEDLYFTKEEVEKALEESN